MPAYSSNFPPINVHLPGVNSVISDTPAESSTSPSSLVADDEPLTVRPHFIHFRPFAYLCPPESERFIILMTANRSLYVRPCCGFLRRRSVHFPLVLVRNRE